VLAPNVELASALFDAVEREFRAGGRDIWLTPQVRDFSSWLREQYLQRQLSSGNLLRCLSDVEERELWREVIDSTEPGRDFLDPAAAARAARRARRTILEYGIPLRAVADDPSEESRAFCQWNQLFEQRCRALGCIGADTLLAHADGGQRPISWIESPTWRPAARLWLSRHGQVLGAQNSLNMTAKRFSAPSPAAELSAIADWALANLEADQSFRAWICVPDLSRRRAEVADALDGALAPQRFTLHADAPGARYALAGGTALADYAPVRAALQTFAATLGPLPFVRFSALLRAPELQASEAEASAAALLDVALRRRANDEADLEAWLDLAERVAHGERLGVVASVARLRTSMRALARLRGAHYFSEWVKAWIEALECAPWSLRGRWSSVEYQAAERFRELLAALATGDAVFGAHSQESAQRILRSAARDTSFQTQTGLPAVWVSGQLLDPWLNYDGLWVSGCGDSQWPPPVDPVPLLPVRLQREYGVIAAAADTQLKFASDLQSRWQARARDCVFSHANPADGSISAPSPLLRENASSLYLPRHPPVAQPHWRAWFEAAPPLERIVDELAPTFTAGESTHGVATLKAQSRCAFRGFAETRLEAQHLEEPVPGFNELERGQLVHHALQHIWSALKDSRSLSALGPDAQHSLLHDGAQRALAMICRIRDPGPRWRLREEVRLRHVLGKWLDVERKRPPFEVESLEQDTQPAVFAGLEFRVRIDRVDRLVDGARVLIDYKTGAARPDWRTDRPDNPQLPIYALLRPDALVAVAYGRVNAGDPGFVAEAERGGIFSPSPRKSGLEGMPDFAALIDLWSQRVGRIAEQFAAGRAEVAPTLRACKTCHLHGLCRVPAALEEGAEFEQEGGFE
jgi:ATP-dependent helicase/nuclease subunit B